MCVKSWESVQIAQKVWENVPKLEKVHQKLKSMLNAKCKMLFLIIVAIQKCAKSWESLKNANAFCYANVNAYY